MSGVHTIILELIVKKREERGASRTENKLYS